MSITCCDATTPLSIEALVNDLHDAKLLDDSQRESMLRNIHSCHHKSFGEILNELYALQYKQLETIIDSEMAKINSDDASHPSDTFAAVVGGLCGMFNAWSSSKDSFNTNYLKNSLSSANEAVELNKNTRKVDFFKIEHMSGMGDRKLILINGFLTQESDPMSNWSVLPSFIDNASFYALHWESGMKSKLSAFHTKLKSASCITETFNHINSNPWKLAYTKSETVGLLLARVLRRNPVLFKGGVSLVGHSLGAAIIFHALRDLKSTGDYHLVDNVVLLGAAVVNTPKEWEELPKAVNGQIVNVYSMNDKILEHFFRVGTLSTIPAAGSLAVKIKNIINIDASELIEISQSTQFGHSYNNSLDAIMKLVQQHHLFE